MDTFLRFAASNAVTATILAVFVAFITRFCRRPAVRHALWLLVLLKLVAPPLLPIPITWPQLESTEAPAPPLDSPSVEPREPLALPEDTPHSDEVPPTDLLASVDWEMTLPIIAWMGGSFVWWTIAVFRVRKFQRLLRQATPAAAEVQTQTQRLAALLGLRHCPPVAFVSAPLSPLLWALGFTPRLLLPSALWQRLDAEQRDTLLAHELAHLRRGDPWIRRLEFVVLGLYWWHPVVWWARRRLQEAEEECCDALVVSVLPDAASAYASALVATVTFLSQARAAAVIGVSGAGQVPLLKRRLTMILTENRLHRPSRAVFWLVLSLGALLLPWAPGARTETTKEGEQAKEPERAQQTNAKNATVKLDYSLLADKQNCASCHIAQTVNPYDLHQKPSNQKSSTWMEAHDEVVKLLDEVKNQRTQLQKSEDRLKRALDILNRLETRSDPNGSLRWNVKWAEALFDRRSTNLGTLKHGTIVEHTFSMTNQGQRPVHIESVRSSAGCLSVKASKVELSPRESASIDARLDTRRFVGDKTLKIYVRFDKPDRQEIVLEIRANSQATVPAKSQSPERLQELEKKLEELRKEMDNLRRDIQPEKPKIPATRPG